MMCRMKVRILSGVIIDTDYKKIEKIKITEYTLDSSMICAESAVSSCLKDVYLI